MLSRRNIFMNQTRIICPLSWNRWYWCRSITAAAPRLGVPQRSPSAHANTPMMRHVGSRDPWAVEICGPFLHPIQPLAHEGLAQHILFDIHKMSGPIEHGKRRSGVGVQQIPGVPVSTQVVLSCGQHERGATKGGGKSVHVKGKGAGRRQLREEG